MYYGPFEEAAEVTRMVDVSGCPDMVTGEWSGANTFRPATVHITLSRATVPTPPMVDADPVRVTAKVFGPRVLVSGAVSEKSTHSRYFYSIRDMPDWLVTLCRHESGTTRALGWYMRTAQ